MNSQPAQSKVGNLLLALAFMLSALIAAALLGIAVWGDVEASMFDLSYKGEENLGTLSCPVLITPRDNAEFSASFSNPFDRNIKPSVKVHISSGHLTLMQEENVKFQLAPAESKQLSWSVDPEDAVYGKMVLVKVFQFPTHPIPSKDATCGILVLDIPTLTGKQIVTGALTTSIIGLVGSTAGWKLNNQLMTKRQRESYRAMGILAATLIIGLAASILGYWLIGSLGLVIAILMAINTIFHLL
jgi:uncharacterized membrane protein YeaQ/YmgE (transglycosylase-associated protein family)